MRRSAAQKIEDEKQPSSESTEKLERQIMELLEEVKAWKIQSIETAEEASERADAKIKALIVEIAAWKAENIAAAERATERASQTSERIAATFSALTLRLDEMQGMANQSADLMRLAEQTLTAASQKEARAAGNLDEMTRTAATLRGALSDIEASKSQIEQTASALRETPKAISGATQQARAELLSATGRLGIKAVPIAVLISVVTMGATVAAGSWYLGRQGIEIQALSKSQQSDLKLGEELQTLYGGWTAEERETWKALRAGKQEPAATSKSKSRQK